MRYLILFGISLVSVLLGSAVLPVWTVFGIQLDLVLAAMVSMVLHERTLTPVFYLAGGSIVMDILFGPGIGFYSVPYFVAGLMVYVFALAKSPVRLMAVPIVAAVAYLLKELITAFLTMLLGMGANVGKTLLTYSIPGALLAALLCFGVHFLFARLYQYNFLRPLAARNKEDFNF
ncbi:MAG: hypothetical protein IJP03_00270 [Christensenellaceae bacterium]|nr:hypothetical protein [Christensenellaceae bacterium]